jgi:hypothetical protein
LRAHAKHEVVLRRTWPAPITIAGCDPQLTIRTLSYGAYPADGLRQEYLFLDHLQLAGGGRRRVKHGAAKLLAPKAPNESIALPWGVRPGVRGNAAWRDCKGPFPHGIYKSRVTCPAGDHGQAEVRACCYEVELVLTERPPS